jgi:hypothetical protein
LLEALGLISHWSLFSPILFAWLPHGTNNSRQEDYNSRQNSVIDSLNRPPSSFEDSEINFINQPFMFGLFCLIPLKSALRRTSLTLEKTVHSNLESTLP